jgi:hypothetical protein
MGRIELRKIRRAAPFIVFAFGIASAYGQSGVSVFFGLGTATDSAAKQPIDTFGNGTLYNPPSMGGLFGKIGGDLMITPHIGFGAQYSFRFTQADYAGLTYRPSFYDVNAIFQPTFGRNRRVVPEFQAGLGGANLKFYLPSGYCDNFAGCTTSSVYLESSNHFQVHAMAAVRFYIKPHVFIRPEFDMHYVHNFFQFGSGFVPQYGASIGYSLGAE